MSSHDVPGSHRGHPDDRSGSNGSGPDDPRVARLQDDIERTRADLADTVDQLAQKLDVKTRVRDQVAEKKHAASVQLHDLRDRATDDTGRPTPAAFAVAGAAVAGLALLLVLRRRRRHHLG